MIYREAVPADIAQLMDVRLSVTENILSNPALIPHQMYDDFLFCRGKGWVCDTDNGIAGFAVADLQAHNIWALFIRPQWEGLGIGTTLHRLMLDWYFLQTKETAWLGTAPASRAELFYRKRGWSETGRRANGEIQFEMTFENWQAARG